VPAFLAILFATNLAMLQTGRIYVVALVAQLVLYALAALGYAWRRRDRVPRIVSVPFYFVMVNYASALGILDAYRGRTYTTWTTARAGDP
jgi:predicted membrane channel-forming protein YqfA (hemolysin III family)